jgi:Ca-activated chloride channel family protein
LPTDQEASFNINGITASYRYNEQSYSTELAQTFTIACVKDKVEALSSVDKREWEQKVLQDDYNRLRENVARDIKTGRKEEALDRIEKYYTEKQAVNSIIGSGQVAGNLAKDVEALRDIVQETFAGKPGAVSLKQKKNAKSLQYESYKGRRLQK